MDTIAPTIAATILSCVVLLARGCGPMHRQAPPQAGFAADSLEHATPELLDRGSRRYESLAEARYRGPAKYLWNAPHTHVLCLEQHRSRSPAGPGMALPALRFFIYDLQADEIIFEDALDNARVAWESDTSIKVVITPGTVPEIEPREFGYRVDVVSGLREDL
ncbi:hypothetical protein JXA88_12935 [Candidatus Fermentibacteria bacterium]|nr:hypothetical protein [Candidatus Fermentibacteria bacterium]